MLGRSKTKVFKYEDVKVRVHCACHGAHASLACFRIVFAYTCGRGRATTIFYDNCGNSRALIGQFLLSICGQKHEFEIHPRRQRAKVGNSLP